MIILGLDSSAVSASCAIVEKEGTTPQKVLACAAVNVKITHSQTLMPLVANTLKTAGMSFNDIDAFAVSNGPGSFTGLRISVSAVKGMAFASDGKPVCGVSTLLSLAHNLVEARASTSNGILACAVMDARRGEVYNALFDVNGETITRLTPDRAISLKDLGMELAQFNSEKREIVLVGDGAELAHNQLLPDNCRLLIAPSAKRYQNAVSVCFAAEKFADVKEIMPVYIRQPQAEREREERKEKEHIQGVKK